MRLDFSEPAARELPEAEKALAASRDRLERLRAPIAEYAEKGITTPPREKASASDETGKGFCV